MRSTTKTRHRIATLCLAALACGATAAAQSYDGKGATRNLDHELEVFVWGPDGSLQPQAVVAVQVRGGHLVKAAPTGSDTHYLASRMGSKTLLEVQHPDLGDATFEVTLPEDYTVLIHVTYALDGKIDMCVDLPEKPGDVPGSGGDPLAAPPNDECEDAIGPLAIPSVTAGTTTDAGTDSGTPDCGPPITSPGVWYTVTGNGNTLTADVCTNTFFDTKISVYCGDCDTPICVDGNDDFCGLQSQVSWCTEAGTEYLILVHGFGGQSGDFELTISDGADCDTPPGCVSAENDACEDAIGPLAVPSVTAGTTDGATVDLDVPDCDVLNTSPGVWYTVTGTGTTMTASLCGGADFDTKLSVYCGDCDTPLCVVGNDDFCGLQSEVSWCSQFGVEYLILVHGFGGQSGPFDLTLSEDGASCDATVFCAPVGACCLADFSCEDGTTEFECVSQGGTYQGDNTQCGGGFLYTVEPCASGFEDISGTGAIGPAGDDGELLVPIGFSFDFFGDSHTSANLSTNGYLTFGPDGTEFGNDPCPDTEVPNDAIFPFWDDFNLNDGGTVYYQTLGAMPNRRFVVQWDGAAEFGTGGADTGTFQAVLFEADSSIEFRYLFLSGVPSFGDDATIGVENQDGTVAFCVPDSEVADGDCVRFTPEDTPPLDCGGCITLDFETEDDFATPLVNGQDISTPPEFGNVVAISATGINLGPTIFDSDPAGPNVGADDPDLLVDLGNVLILQDPTENLQTVPGIFDEPDDSNTGGTLIFDFVTPVEAESVTLIDIDIGIQDALVTLVDSQGRSREYLCPSGWTRDRVLDGPPGYAVLDLTTLADQPGFVATATASETMGFDPTDVVRIEAFFTSSAGLDDLVVCPQ